LSWLLVHEYAHVKQNDCNYWKKKFQELRYVASGFSKPRDLETPAYEAERDYVKKLLATGVYHGRDKISLLNDLSNTNETISNLNNYGSLTPPSPWLLPKILNE